MPTSNNLPAPTTSRVATRARLRLILDRYAGVIIVLSTLYWVWVRISASDAIQGARAFLVAGTMALALVGSVCWFHANGKIRLVGKALVLASALFWLLTMYQTGGQTVYFFDRPLTLAYLHKFLLCASACFTLSYVLAMLLKIGHAYPRPTAQAFFLLGAVVVVVVSVDLWFCIDPPVEPAAVGEFVYRKQYHPVFTYAVEHTYVTRDARERTVRDYLGTSFPQVKPPGTVRIVLSGASTVWGHGLAEPQTLRTQLESHLKARLPDRQWEVICVAYQGKYQLNELVDTVAVLPQWTPDLVISLNGYNEIWYGETPGRYFGQPFIDEQTRLNFAQTVFARLTHLGPVAMALGSKPRLISATDVNREIQPLFYNQLRLSARALKGLHIPYAFSFCPNVFELSDATRDELTLRKIKDEPAAGDERWKSTVVRERRSISDQIVSEEGQIAFDVMSMLAGASTSRFIDECHLTADATEVLASRLTDRIPEWLSGND